MRKNNYWGISISIILSYCLLMAGCDKTGTFSDEYGFLKGTIHIGPICPVERIPPDPACQPTAETFKAFPVTIWTSDARVKVMQVSPSLDGLYSIELIPGNYLVRLEQNKNMPGGSNLPQNITILPGDTTLLEINIDTGIR